MKYLFVCFFYFDQISFLAVPVSHDCTKIQWSLSIIKQRLFLPLVLRKSLKRYMNTGGVLRIKNKVNLSRLSKNLTEKFGSPATKNNLYEFCPENVQPT